jgi:hypothetical protein
MSVLKLFFKMVFKDKLSLLLLFLMMVVLSYSMMMTIRAVDVYTQITRFADQGNFKNRILYTFNDNFDEGARTKLATEGQTIEAVEGVQSVDNIGTYNMQTTSGTYQYFRLLNCHPESLRDIKYPLVKGSYPDPEQSNFVILTSPAMSFYDIGDTIEVFVFDGVPDGTEIEDIPIAQLTVAGFLRDDILLNGQTIYSRADLTAFFSSFRNDPDHDIYGVVYAVEDTEGNPIATDLSEMFIITPQKGQDIHVLADRVAQVVVSKDMVHAGPDLYQRYWENTSDVARKIIGVIVSTFSLALTTLIAGTLFSLMHRQKEMSVYYCFGATWRQSVLLVVAQKIPVILAGYILGVYLYSISGSRGIFPGADCVFLWQYIYISFPLCLGLFAIGLLPFYIMTVRKSPMELFRKD